MMHQETIQTLPRETLALFLDVDGTLLDVAPSPDAVDVPASLRRSLHILERRLGGALALISGRTIAELDRLFSPLRLRASGVYGGEIRPSPARMEITRVAPKIPDAAWVELTQILHDFPGAFAENKEIGFTIHHRKIESRLDRLVDALAGLMTRFSTPPLDLHPGNFAFELRVAGIDKGTAITQFMTQAPFIGRVPVFIGDDALDRPAFKTVLEQGGLAFSVGRHIPGLSGSFEEPAAVRNWLRSLCR